MEKLDRISGSVLFLLALLLAIETRRLPFWGPMGPKQGFFPLVLVVLLGIFGLVIYFRSLLSKHPGEKVAILGPDRRKLFSYVITFLLFGIVLGWLGYTLTMTLYLVLILRFVEKQTLKLTLITVLFSIVLSYFMFVKFLGIPLPEGILTPVADFLRRITM